MGKKYKSEYIPLKRNATQIEIMEAMPDVVEIKQESVVKVEPEDDYVPMVSVLSPSYTSSKVPVDADRANNQLSIAKLYEQKRSFIMNK